MNVSRSLAGVAGMMLAVTVSVPAMATERSQEASSVESWLALQREGSKSVPEYKRVEGEMSQRAYRRLLESFEHGIPARLLDDDELSTGTSR
ncbi:MAG: DUF3613 domain-containing protein [Pseudomonadota bacterium]